jgi:hypothetical protein
MIIWLVLMFLPVLGLVSTSTPFIGGTAAVAHGVTTPFEPPSVPKL